MSNTVKRGKLSEYYKDELKKLNENIDKCNTDFLNSIEYFLEEANSHTTGIPTDIENIVKKQMRSFRYNCTCHGRTRPISL